MTIKVIAWDFDGVLNRNIVDGSFIWHQNFDEDLGANVDDFSNFMFRSGRFEKALIGDADLANLIAEWLETFRTQLTVDELLSYWFENDAHPDHRSIQILKAADAKGVRNIIATNNEERRASFIENEMGFSELVEQLFAAGRIGAAKPDNAFFDHVMNALDVAPQEIMLVDDCRLNVDAAQECGWRAFHFLEGDYESLEKLISNAAREEC